MSRRGLWAIGLGLSCAIWVTGCQSTGVTGDGDSRAPSFGVDHVPRQYEPNVDTDDEGRSVSARDPDEKKDDAADSEAAGRKGNLLTRLLPGRDKEIPERKPLPVSQRSAGTDGDETDDDDDFEF